MSHHLLVLHGAVLGKHGGAIILPAHSGSGKSTLCAGMLHRGWRLLADAVPCPAHPDIRVLSPTDMILHSAMHLFQDGEFDHTLRDLFDLQDLLIHVMKTEENWETLIARSEPQGMGRPLYYALCITPCDIESDACPSVAATSVSQDAATPASGQ